MKNIVKIYNEILTEEQEGSEEISNWNNLEMKLKKQLALKEEAYIRKKIKKWVQDLKKQAENQIPLIADSEDEKEKKEGEQHEDSLNELKEVI